MNDNKISSVFLKIVTVIISISLILLKAWMFLIVPGFIVGKLFAIPLRPSVVLWCVFLASILPILFGALGIYKAIYLSPYAYKMNIIGKYFMGVLSIIQVLIPLSIYIFISKHLPCMLSLIQVAGIIVIHAVILLIILMLYIFIDKNICFRNSKKYRKSNR